MIFYFVANCKDGRGCSTATRDFMQDPGGDGGDGNQVVRAMA